MSVVNMSVRFAFVCLFSVAVVACSSSNNGAVLPEKEFDSEAPKVTLALPDVEDGELVSTRLRVDLTFNELLDEQSLVESAALFSQNALDINLGMATVKESKTELSLYRRALKIDIKEILITETVEDTDGETVKREATVNKVSFSSQTRLALNSYYKLKLSETLKDRSPIESFNPETGAPDTGNFIEDAYYDYFQTLDGAWQSNQTILDVRDSNDFIQSSFGPKVVAYQDQAVAVWRQTYEKSAGGSSVGLWASSFDASTETWASDSSGELVFTVNLESMSLDADEPGVVLGNVVELELYGDDTRACAVWWQDAMELGFPVSRLYTRCIVGGVWGPKLFITSLDASTPQDLTLVENVGGKLLVSFLTDQRVDLYDIPFFTSALPSISLVHSVGSADQKIMAYDLRATIDGRAQLIMAIDQSSDISATKPYSVVAQSVYFASDSLELSTSVTLDQNDKAFSSLSQGFDFRGQGFSGWLVGDNSFQEFVYSRFDGATWGAPKKVKKDGRGNISEASIKVAYEGHAIFAWIQELGSTKDVRVFGYFAGNGGESFVTPRVPKTILNTAGAISELSINCDQEGNMFVSLVDGGAKAMAFRFSDNSTWENAWGSGQTLKTAASITSFDLVPVLDDGRFISVFGARGASVQQVSMGLFTD